MAKTPKAQESASLKDLRGMSAPDLQAQAVKLREEVWSTRLKLRDGSAQQSHHIRQSKRQIARILTVLKEQSLKNAKGRT